MFVMLQVDPSLMRYINNEGTRGLLGREKTLMMGASREKSITAVLSFASQPLHVSVQ
jgi:hypothetical protein